MTGRGGGGFAANASDRTPYVFHWSLTIEFGYVRPPAISLAQVDCSSSFCTVHAKVREICSVHFACKRLPSFFAFRDCRFAFVIKPWFAVFFRRA